MMTAAIIIAAGKRTNRNSFEPGQKIGTISAIKRIVLLFQKFGIREIVVCGEEEEVKKMVPSMNVIFLPCPQGGEMMRYIQMGIAYLQDKADQVFVTHVNVPMFSLQTMSALCAAEGTVCIPACHGKTGHPVLLRHACFRDILEYTGGNGLRAAMSAWQYEKKIVEVDDVGILGYVPELSESELVADHDAGKLWLSAQFRIGREQNFLGPGVQQLLHLVEELQSLSDACRYMGISNSKGRKIIQAVEQQMGIPVLHTQQGGRGGGHSRLTEQARDLICRYDAFQAEAEDLLKPLFEKYFGDLIQSLNKNG